MTRHAHWSRLRKGALVLALVAPTAIVPFFQAPVAQAEEPFCWTGVGQIVCGKCVYVPDKICGPG